MTLTVGELPWVAEPTPQPIRVPAEDPAVLPAAPEAVPRGYLDSMLFEAVVTGELPPDIGQLPAHDQSLLRDAAAILCHARSAEGARTTTAALESYTSLRAFLTAPPAPGAPHIASSRTSVAEHLREQPSLTALVVGARYREDRVPSRGALRAAVGRTAGRATQAFDHFMPVPEGVINLANATNNEIAAAYGEAHRRNPVISRVQGQIETAAPLLWARAMEYADRQCAPAEVASALTFAFDEAWRANFAQIDGYPLPLRTLHADIIKARRHLENETVHIMFDVMLDEVTGEGLTADEAEAIARQAVRDSNMEDALMESVISEHRIRMDDLREAANKEVFAKKMTPILEEQRREARIAAVYESAVAYNQDVLTNTRQLITNMRRAVELADNDSMLRILMAIREQADARMAIAEQAIPELWDRHLERLITHLSSPEELHALEVGYVPPEAILFILRLNPDAMRTHQLWGKAHTLRRALMEGAFRHFDMKEKITGQVSSRGPESHTNAYTSRIRDIFEVAHAYDVLQQGIPLHGLDDSQIQVLGRVIANRAAWFTRVAGDVREGDLHVRMIEGLHDARRWMKFVRRNRRRQIGRAIIDETSFAPRA